MNKYVYIPVEIKSREFIAKLILAFELALRDYCVVIGKSIEVEKICQCGPNGIYLGTSIMKQHNSLFKTIRNSGSKVVAADEEGLVYYNEDNFKKNKIYYQTFENLEVFIAWGNHHKELIKEKCPDIIDKVHSIGNVRMEILKPQYRFLYKKEADMIKKKYGKYVLINTNFGAYNNYISTQNYLDIAKRVAGEDDKDALFRYEKIEHQHLVFDAFRDFAILLKNTIPEINIIVRPHPSENLDRWKKEFDGTGIMVIREGNVIPWILMSQCVIQQNCTTAIETICLDVPVFSFLPFFDVRFDDGLPNKIAPVFEKSNELLSAIIQVIEDKKIYEGIYINNHTVDLNNYVSNLSRDTSVFDSYIDVFDMVDVDRRYHLKKWFIKCKYRIHDFFYWIININKKKREIQKYISQKFPHTEYSEWIDVMNQINISNSNRYGELKMTRYANDTYLIKKDV